MHVALWDEPAADFLAQGLDTGTVEADVLVERVPRARCIDLLRTGQVDLALIPSLELIRNVEDYDLLPAAALSAWGFPYVRLFLRQGLDQPIRSVAFDPQHGQEVLLARMILREHYGATPQFVPLQGPTSEDLLASDADAALLVGGDVPLLRTDRLSLDVGQEWYELANYPMVWGLFATLKGHATPPMVHLVHDLAEAAEAGRGLWLQAHNMPAPIDAFYRDDLRVRLDDLAVASLTEWQQYLFYYDVVSEVAELPIVMLPDEEEQEGDEE